jgi:hypothetical protein
LWGSCGGKGEEPQGWLGINPQCCSGLELCSITGTCLSSEDCKSLTAISYTATGAVFGGIIVLLIVLLIIYAYFFYKKSNQFRGFSLFLIGFLILFYDKMIGFFVMLLGAIVLSVYWNKKMKYKKRKK